MNQRTFSFPQIINRISGKIELSSNTQSINECLGILLRTRPGEMLGDPDWGCYLIDRVFGYRGVVLAELIKEDILDAVQKYEPRITMTTDDITIVNNIPQHGKRHIQHRENEFRQKKIIPYMIPKTTKNAVAAIITGLTYFST